MSDADLEAGIAAARTYEALFVPALFAPWAPRVADAAGLKAGQRVLDVACGTGVLAREARLRTTTEGRVVGLDPAAGMLAVAGESMPDFERVLGAAEAMPFADGCFDAVVCQFGLMFMDAQRALQEMLRVLKPGGRLAVAVWNRISEIPGFAAEVGLLERMAGREAADALRAPFALGDRDLLLALFHGAGIGPVALATVEGIARFPSLRTMMEVELRGWLPLMGVTLTEEVIAAILDEAESALGNYVTAEGGAMFDVSAHIVTAVK